jgi:hypothetical protein
MSVGGLVSILAYLATPMYSSRYLVFDKKTGREGVLVVGDTGFSDAIIWAKSAVMLTELKADFEVPADALVITLT